MKIKLTSSYGCRSIAIDQLCDEPNIDFDSQADLFGDFSCPIPITKPTDDLTKPTDESPPAKKMKGIYTPQIVFQAGTFESLVRLTPAINRYMEFLKSMSGKFVTFRDDIIQVVKNICEKNRAIPKIKPVLLPFLGSIIDQIIEEVWSCENDNKDSPKFGQDETADVCHEILIFCIDNIIDTVISD